MDFIDFLHAKAADPGPIAHPAKACLDRISLEMASTISVEQELEAEAKSLGVYHAVRDLWLAWDAHRKRQDEPHALDALPPQD